MSSEVLPGLRLRKINVEQKDSTVPTVATLSKEADEPVTPAGRLFMEPDLSCHILCTLAFANPINLAEFKQTLLVTLVNHKRFQSIIVKDKNGRDIWVQVEVNIDDHIVEPNIDISDTAFVENYVTDLAIAPPLDETRPMWQCHILNGKSGDAAAHMILRIHHALGDGTSLMSLMLACTRRVGNPDELPAVPVARIREKETKSAFRYVLRLLILFWNTLVGIFLFSSTAIWLKDSESIIKGYAGVEKNKKKLNFVPLELTDIITVKNAVNGTINDVLMGIVGSALRTYLKGRDAASSPSKSAGGKIETVGKSDINAEVAKNKSKTALKVEKLRIRACTLMNTRGSPGLQELASMMDGGSQQQWGNHLGYLIMDIPLQHYLDPLDYVRAAKKLSDRKKASLEGIFTYWSGAMLMGLTGPTPPLMLTRRVILQTTLTVSNVPGPTEAVTFAGNPIVGIFPMVSGHPQSLSIYLQTYMGKASLVIMAAESAVPDPEVLCNLCVDTLKDMMRAAKSRSEPQAK